MPFHLCHHSSPKKFVFSRKIRRNLSQPAPSPKVLLFLSQCSLSLCRLHTPSPQYCETCDAHFQDTNHRTSTAHLLSLSRGFQPHNLPLGMPTSSPGFKLLLRGGWEPGKGLGPRGNGRANPIPTVLKRDQEGLGYRSTLQARVTHFPAWDTRAVAGRERAPRVATLSRREERRKEEKDRAWERNLRTYMNLEF